MQPMLLNAFSDFGETLYENLIAEDRYKMILQGFGNTLLMAIGATLIGVAIGLVIAIVKYFASGNKKLWILDKLCDVYITVIRGTPIVVQLLIMYTAIFAAASNGLPVAILAFGINSGAYVAEIIRGGIFAVDKGQTEAGRSLGLNKIQTMRHIVLPQAFKNFLPALGNEFIALLKETSVAGYIAVRDLTKAADLIRGRTFNSTSLFTVALIYLLLVMVMTKGLKILERRLSKNDKR